MGNVQRDSSGKIIRDEPLTQRGANGMREFFNQNGEKVSHRVSSALYIVHVTHANYYHV